jgi:hypothetical protein
MFLCKECGTKDGYDAFLWMLCVSWGPCECCGITSECIDL